MLFRTGIAILSTVCALGIAVGCSSDDDAAAVPTSDAGAEPPVQDAGPTEGVDASTFEVRIATAECAFEERCRADFFRDYYGTSASCVVSVLPRYLERGIRFGTAPDLAAQVDACARDFEEQACSSSYLPASCTLRGTAPDGASCGMGLDCASGSCVGGAGRCGTCAALAPAGTSCEGRECASGASCSGELGARRCLPPAGDGEACEPLSLAPCVSGFTCSSATKRCVRLLPAGSICSLGSTSCEASLRCLNERCTAPTPAGVGEACGDDASGVWRLCHGSRCEDGVCRAILGEGASCTQGVATDASPAPPACQSPLSCIQGVCTLSAPTKCD